MIRGVSLPSGGKLIIDYNGVGFNKLPVGLERVNDNRIITIAKMWQKKETERDVVIITKDINLRLKASACGIKAEDYLSDKKIKKAEDLYSGVVEICLPIKKEFMVERWYKEFKIPFVEIGEEIKREREKLLFNQCCLIKTHRISGSERVMLALYKGKYFKVIQRMSKNCREKGKIIPLNIEQDFAYGLLMDDEIELVTLVGKAGTGKTLIALLAGYHLLEEKYEQILVYRPNIELGNPLGFLPGDRKEKFEPWTYPIIDNLKIILAPEGQKDYTGKKKEHKSKNFDIVGEFLESGLISIEPINYIRGRSLHNCFVIIDEAQNLTPHAIKSVITRAGSRTKMVLTGDIYQIDNPYLDSTSNGLSYVVEKMKGQATFGHITLRKSERSRLAEMAANLL